MGVAERLDISKELKALCEKFGVEYSAVSEIVIRPGEACVTVHKLKRNKHGRFYLDESEPSTELRFDIRT